MHDLIAIDVSSNTPEELGRRRFRTHPKIGEWVELTFDRKKTIFEVVMIAHGDNERVTNIYVKRLGDHSEAIKKICKQSDQ